MKLFDLSLDLYRRTAYQYIIIIIIIIINIIHSSCSSKKVPDRDADSIVVSHVSNVGRRACEVGRYKLFKDDIFRQVNVDCTVVRLCA